ncbi:MAG: DsbA family oxidoreductase [Woeseiaceae bacterium]|nr:DsbA family oxidoreductase [Woeseiaceae bacterium]
MSETLSNIVRTNDRVTPTAALHVEAIADIVCPFCYLGLMRLEKALEAVQGPSEVTWYPWQLNPELPVDGVDFNDYLASRFGSAENIGPVLEGLALEGKAEGIDFRFDRITRVPNTMRAHQLLYLAETRAVRQMALAKDLMAAFFEHGEDLGDIEVLVKIGTRHGLEAKDIIATVDGDEARQVVTAREAQARSSGIDGVPGFLLNRRLLLIGAQETDNIINAFDRAMFGEGTDELISPALH